MNTEDRLFIHKHQPLYFKDFGEDNEAIKIIKTLMSIDNLNILLIGDMASGKTSILNTIIREYYTLLSFVHLLKFHMLNLFFVSY